jgi:hypothetical protein
MLESNGFATETQRHRVRQGLDTGNPEVLRDLHPGVFAGAASKGLTGKERARVSKQGISKV